MPSVSISDELVERVIDMYHFSERFYDDEGGYANPFSADQLLSDSEDWARLHAVEVDEMLRLSSSAESAREYLSELEQGDWDRAARLPLDCVNVEAEVAKVKQIIAAVEGAQRAQVGQEVREHIWELARQVSEKAHSVLPELVRGELDRLAQDGRLDAMAHEAGISHGGRETLAGEVFSAGLHDRLNDAVSAEVQALRSALSDGEHADQIARARDALTQARLTVSSCDLDIIYRPEPDERG